jgi:hypothetical protein
MRHHRKTPPPPVPRGEYMQGKPGAAQEISLPSMILSFIPRR